MHSRIDARVAESRKASAVGEQTGFPGVRPQALIGCHGEQDRCGNGGPADTDRALWGKAGVGGDDAEWTMR